MIILGIETSCDETAASLVQDGTKILSNIVASSQELHIKTGGIIPEVAAREQIKCIVPVIEEALTSKIYNLKSNIDAIAVTIGPGLIGSLLVGVETAKTLAYLWNKPIIAVNHLLAHVYANFLQHPSSIIHHPVFPALALIASGGHTELILTKSHGKYKWIGGTRDDAAGECFDKCARLLNLGYPGGPAIAAEADKPITHNSKLITHLPRPMINSDDFDFSFSGLKTAVLREVKKLPITPACAPASGGASAGRHNSELITTLAFETQEAITDVLVEKTLRAAKKYQVESILLAGGVAANQVLRKKFQVLSFKSQVNFFAPPKNLCTDNAACVASCAYFSPRANQPWAGNFSPIPPPAKAYSLGRWRTGWKKIQALPSLGL